MEQQNEFTELTEKCIQSRQEEVHHAAGHRPTTHRSTTRDLWKVFDCQVV